MARQNGMSKMKIEMVEVNVKMLCFWRQMTTNLEKRSCQMDRTDMLAYLFSAMIIWVIVSKYQRNRKQELRNRVAASFLIELTIKD